MPPPSPEEQDSDNPWAPFPTQGHFELAELMFDKMSMSQGHINQLMDVWASFSMPFGAGPPFASFQDLYSTIDAVPFGDSPWASFRIKYSGPVPDAASERPPWMASEYTVWHRNLLDVVKSILSNPNFVPDFDQAPYREFVGDKRRWTDFMSGNWAWDQAVSPSFSLDCPFVTNYYM